MSSACARPCILLLFWGGYNPPDGWMEKKKITRTSKSSKSDDCVCDDFFFLFLFLLGAFWLCHLLCHDTNQRERESYSRWKEFGGSRDDKSTRRPIRNRHHLPSSSRSFTRQVRIAPFTNKNRIRKIKRESNHVNGWDFLIFLENIFLSDAETTAHIDLPSLIFISLSLMAVNSNAPLTDAQTRKCV